MADAVTFDRVVKTYQTGLLGRGPGVEAVRGVTLAVPAGGVFGLLGPNRAGKTTLVKLLLSLAAPTAGTVTRLGRPLADRSTLARVGYMHENHAFPRYLTAVELLGFYGGLSGVPSAELDGRVERLLDRVGLGDRRAEPIARFSKGMVQRLGLAQALVTTPTCSSSTSRPRGSTWTAGSSSATWRGSSGPRGRRCCSCRTSCPR